jgi:hypothetical protein
MSNEEDYQRARKKVIDHELYDMDDAVDKLALTALAEHKARSLVEGHMKEEKEGLLKNSKLRREFGKLWAERMLQKGDVLTTDEEAFVKLYAETFYPEFTLALVESVGITVDPYAVKMPWGAWEFDFTDGLGAGWLNVDELAKERAVAAVNDSHAGRDQEYAQYLLSIEDLHTRIDSACSFALSPTDVWTSDKTLFHVYFDPAFKAYYLAELKKKAGVLTESDAALESAHICAELSRLTNEQKKKQEKEQQRAQAEQEQKKHELFPDPEPLRVEVAGTIINFTSWDAALIVYMDCSQGGKKVEVKCLDALVQFTLSKTGRTKVEIVERSSGNTTVCAAVFPRIPLATEYHRKALKAVKRVECKVLFSFFTPEYIKWEETVSLFRGNVVELDWRGRKA